MRLMHTRPIAVVVTAAACSFAPVAAGSFASPASVHHSKPSGRQVITCLSKSGLIHAWMRGTGLWSGDVRGTTWSIYVNGPYPNNARANASVRSLAGIEDAARGGHWVVSAPIRGHLIGKVRKVSSCLNRAAAAKATKR